jgi:hypothetical protein
LRAHRCRHRPPERIRHVPFPRLHDRGCHSVLKHKEPNHDKKHRDFFIVIFVLCPTGFYRRCLRVSGRIER